MEEQDMISPLDYTSGCTSGWTMYLDRSLSANEEALFPCKNNPRFSVEEEEEETTDLSMVSDASSGPPHLHDGDEGHGHGFCIDQRERWFCKKAALANKEGKRRKADIGRREDGPSSLLADTASSHHLSFSQCFNPSTNKMGSSPEVEDVLDFSIGFSTTHFNGKSALQNHCGFMDASLPLKPTSKAKPRRKHEEDAW